MLVKKTSGAARPSHLAKLSPALAGGVIDRRSFLRRSGLAAGGLGAALAPRGGMMGKAEAQTAGAGAAKNVKTVCTHCSVGCTVIATVENGVWTRQEPGFDSPFNLGAHCAKGASVREHAHGERRLKYPMKLVDGKWTRIALGPGDHRDRRQAAARCARSRALIPSIGWAAPSIATSRPISCASSSPSGAATTATTRRASATRRRSPALPIPGATAR